VKPACIR